MARLLDAAAPDFAARFEALLAEPRGSAEAAEAARAIIAEVRERGDAALVDFARRFDRAELSAGTLRVGTDEIDAAERDCSAETLEALGVAARRIEAFHRRQLPQDVRYTDEAGMTLGWRWTPVDSAGVYVPGGTASYPSSVLMNALPARVAGVARIAMATPAADGRIAPSVLVAAKLAGIGEIYRMGGAQAIAALAYGTATVAPVAKIAGPGNAYVAAAKREVFGTVGIDAIAGPSEVVVVADGANNPEWIAADLLAQAEHDAAAQSILITEDRGFAGRVAEAVARLLAGLPRRAVAEASWRNHGAIIVAPRAAAPALIDRIAPEHLQLAVRDPDALAEQVRHAGAIFLGARTPEALGDYVAGPSHVLPTGGAARFSSGLSVFDFLKRTTLAGADDRGLAAIGPAAATLAGAEGLDAHALSLRLRLKGKGGAP